MTLLTSRSEANSMSNQQFFVKLREILAFLYSDEADAHRIAQDADLDVGNIAFSSKAINNWNAILLQAQKEGKTANLMAMTFKDYKENEKLSTAWHDYLIAVGKKKPDSPFDLTPKRKIHWSWGWLTVAVIILAGVGILLLWYPFSPVNFAFFSETATKESVAIQNVTGTTPTLAATTASSPAPTMAPQPTQRPSIAPSSQSLTTPPCAPAQLPSPSPLIATTLLYSSLDDPTALTSPGIGQGDTSENLLASDFVQGQTGNALAFVREGLYVVFPVSTGSGQNIDLNQGEAEFWYCPNYDSTTVTNPRMVLFRVALDASNPPALELGAGTNLSLSVTDAQWNTVSTASRYAAPLWKAGEWVHIRATWDNTLSTDSLQIYVNGERKDRDHIAGGWNLGTDTAKLKIHLGQAGGFLIADGAIDELFIRR
jgi:hypothetical protein